VSERLASVDVRRVLVTGTAAGELDADALRGAIGDEIARALGDGANVPADAAGDRVAAAVDRAVANWGGR
jgi:hypothetical protein